MMSLTLGLLGESVDLLGGQLGGQRGVGGPMSPNAGFSPLLLNCRCQTTDSIFLSVVIQMQCIQHTKVVM